MSIIYKFKYLLIIMLFSSTAIAGNYGKLAYDFSFNDIDGSKLNLSEFKNKVIIVVNVASQCGFTSQYEDMQTIWDSYQTKGIIMIGVPSNDFGNQEPGTNSEIKNFCEAKFGITLKNIGPRMSFEGDGDDVTLTGPNGSDMTVELRSAAFELPSLLNIGGAYSKNFKMICKFFYFFAYNTYLNFRRSCIFRINI